ncbi:MAG: RNA polymerase sigma-70 factor, partial [Bacteroidota bacterium]
FGQLPEMKVNKSFTKNDLKNIYEQYFEQLRGFLYYKTGNIELAEDLVQEVFVKLWDKKDGIKKETVKSLLYTMANNLMINHFNHQKVVSKYEQASAHANKEENRSPQFHLEEKEFEIKFNNAIAALPEGCREVFLMNRIDKLKYEEIASRLDLSVKAIEKRMSKAIAILKNQLGMKI